MCPILFIGFNIIYLMFNLANIYKPFLGVIWPNIVVEHPLICVDSKSLNQLYKKRHICCFLSMLIAIGYFQAGILGERS